MNINIILLLSIIMTINISWAQNDSSNYCSFSFDEKYANGVQGHMMRVGDYLNNEGQLEETVNFIGAGASYKITVDLNIPLMKIQSLKTGKVSQKMAETTLSEHPALIVVLKEKLRQSMFKKKRIKVTVVCPLPELSGELE